MSAWSPIATAPRMTTVEVRTAAGRKLFAFYDPSGSENERGVCGAWIAAVEGKHPACWTDGLCWEFNENEQPSDPPVRWRPAAATVGA